MEKHGPGHPHVTEPPHPAQRLQDTLHFRSDGGVGGCSEGRLYQAPAGSRFLRGPWLGLLLRTALTTRPSPVQHDKQGSRQVQGPSACPPQNCSPDTGRTVLLAGLSDPLWNVW